MNPQDKQRREETCPNRTHGIHMGAAGWADAKDYIPGEKKGQAICKSCGKACNVVIGWLPDRAQEEFKEEVRAGLHPDWAVDPSGELVDVSDKNLEQSGAEYFQQYPHGPPEDE